MQPQVFYSNLLLFDFGLRQSIDTFWLFMWACLALNLDKRCPKWDLVFDGIVIFMHYKMINLDSITNENNKKHSGKWPYIPGHPYWTIIIGSSGSWKTNALINLINEQNDIDKTYLCARDLSKPKYEYLIKKREDAGKNI